MPASQARVGLQAKDQSHDVALFIDWENLKSSLSQANMRVNLTSLRETAETFGRVVIANAYADWQDDWHQSDPENLYAAAIEPVYVPSRVVAERTGVRRRKNSVDVKLTADCVECCHNHPNIGTFILVSGDGDFIHMVNTLRPYGKQVVAVGVSWSTSARLADRVDQFLYYDKDVDPIDTRHYRTEGAAAGAREDADLQQALDLVVEIIRGSQHGDRALLSWIKNELLRRLRQFDESRFGFAKFKLFMREAERRGLLHIVEDGLVDWACLPGAQGSEDLEAGEVAPLEPVDETALPAIIHFADGLENRSPYVAFMYLVDQAVRAAILPHLRRDQLMLLLNEAVEDLVFLRAAYSLEDPSTGKTKNIRTVLLNREHPLVQQTLAEPAAEHAAASQEGAGEQPSADQDAAGGSPSGTGSTQGVEVHDAGPGEQKPEAADAELTRIAASLEADPGNPALLMRAARRHFQLRQYDEAIRYQQQAIEREPGNVEYRCLLARTLSTAQRTEQAAALCRQAAEGAPESPLPHMTLGSILYVQGDAWAEAAAEFEQALEHVGDDAGKKAQLLLNIARCYERLGEEEAAERCCRQGLALVPDQPGLLEFQSYLRLRPTEREGFQLAKQAAALAVQPGREAEATETAQRAILAYPEQYLPHYALGEVHQRLQRFRAAAESLEKAGALCPSPATRAAIYQKLARLHSKLGDSERAQQAQLQAASLGLERVTTGIGEEV